MCVCVCVCVLLLLLLLFSSSLSFQHMWSNNKSTFYLYNFFIISIFLTSVLVLRWSWNMNLTKLSRELHHQGNALFLSLDRFTLPWSIPYNGSHSTMSIRQIIGMVDWVFANCLGDHGSAIEKRTPESPPTMVDLYIYIYIYISSK